LVSKDLLEQLVTMVSLERWVPRVFKVCPDPKDQEVPRVMVARPEKMVSQEMAVQSVTPVFLESLVCQDPLVPLEPVVLMELRETSDLPALKASKAFQVLRDPLASLVKREPSVLPESLVHLDALVLVESVVTLEREDLLESKGPKALLVLLAHLVLRVLLVSLETREKPERAVLKDCKDFLD